MRKLQEVKSRGRPGLYLEVEGKGFYAYFATPELRDQWMRYFAGTWYDVSMTFGVQCSAMLW